MQSCVIHLEKKLPFLFFLLLQHSNRQTSMLTAISGKNHILKNIFHTKLKASTTALRKIQNKKQRLQQFTATPHLYQHSRS